MSKKTPAHSWLPLSTAASKLGMSKDALHGRGVRKTWPRRKHHGAWVYAVPSNATPAGQVTFLNSLHASAKEAQKDLNVEAVESTLDLDAMVPPINAKELLAAGANTKKRYFTDSDNYYFSLKSVNGLFKVSRQTIEAVVASYSAEGTNSTLQEIARTNMWTKRTTRELLSHLGIQHSSLPFTDEQLAEGDEDDLVTDLVRTREQRVFVRGQRKMLAEQEKLAHSARNIREFIQSVFGNMTLPKPPPRPTPITSVHSNASPITVVSHATDLHYGKDGWRLAAKDEFYSREECRDRLLKATDDVMRKALLLGPVDEVILGVGGDWFHVDNPRNTTTGGTPQDNDGNYRRVFLEGSQLAYEHIEMWRRYGTKVTVVAVNGNHDYTSTMHLVFWLQAMYRDVDGVDVIGLDEDRTYLKVGQTLLGLTHGDGLKDNDLRGLMAHEAKDIWSTCNHYLWLTGHWHSQIVSEQYGILVEHLPSLAGSDAWHHKKGYVGNRKLLMAHLICHDEGPVAKIWADAKYNSGKG